MMIEDQPMKADNTANEERQPTLTQPSDVY